ncbi:MAG: dihydroxyacetone kinase subunit DhaL [Nocardioidaceae bacterium]
MADVSLAQVQDWLVRAKDSVTEQRSYLTELDSAIGDADHGSNLTRGFGAVVDKLASQPAASIEALLKASGMTLVSTVGGASGPLYGTMLLRMGKAVGDADTMTATQLGEALRAGLEGVVARGKAEPGDKTMVDALGPAVEAFEKALTSGEGAATAATAAAQAAAAGRDDTEPLVARKGRASYLGERSAGHIDPGSASVTLLLEALAAALADG